MIDSFNDAATGWARFSDETPDPVMRYRLGRACSPRAQGYLQSCVGHRQLASEYAALKRVVFVMLNPSTANAFKPDLTVSECIRFSKLWVPDLDLVEVVNLFAFRTPHPKVLKAAAVHGDDAVADQQILEACTGAHLVITAWGTGGGFRDRDIHVARLLARDNIGICHIGRTKDGFPKHPLARGKHRIPREQQPIPWRFQATSAAGGIRDDSSAS